MSGSTYRWPDGLELRHDLRHGDLGRLIALHGEVYARWPDFGLEFEAFVARTVAEYGLQNAFNGRIWFLEAMSSNARAELVGCCAIAMRSSVKAQLRWVLLKQAWCGKGIGRRLVDTALDYCRGRGVEEVYLETTDGLDASAALYRKLGFSETSNEIVPMWRGSRPLIRMTRKLEQSDPIEDQADR